MDHLRQRSSRWFGESSRRLRAWRNLVSRGYAAWPPAQRAILVRATPRAPTAPCFHGFSSRRSGGRLSIRKARRSRFAMQARRFLRPMSTGNRATPRRSAEVLQQLGAAVGPPGGVLGWRHAGGCSDRRRSATAIGPPSLTDAAGARAFRGGSKGGVAPPLASPSVLHGVCWLSPLSGGRQARRRRVRDRAAAAANAVAEHPRQRSVEPVQRASRRAVGGGMEASDAGLSIYPRSRSGD